MLEAGFVARRSSVVNWDPVDQTVLANEQVIDGKGWRSGAPVERRELVQWVFRISRMADELLAAIDGLEAWPEKVRLMQANWIGKSRGLQFTFNTLGAPPGFERLEVYTTAAGHAAGRELCGDLAGPSAGAGAGGGRSGGWRRSTPSAAASAPRRRRWRRRRSAASTPASACGTRWTPGWELPVWIANFILMDYGTGAIFGCPAHDQRDLDFRAEVRAAGDRRLHASWRAANRSPRRPMCRRRSEPVRYVRAIAGDEVMTGEAAVEAAIEQAEREGFGQRRHQL